MEKSRKRDDKLIKEPSTDIIAAYQSAIELAIYEGGIAWQATSVYIQFALVLFVGSIFPSFTGSSNPQIQSTTGFVLSIVGVVATTTWWSMIGRSRTYYNYWIFTARELEGHLSDPVQTLRRGAKFAEGNTVLVDGEKIGFSFGGRIKTRLNLSFVYATFLVVFAALVVINTYKIIVAF